MTKEEIRAEIEKRIGERCDQRMLVNQYMACLVEIIVEITAETLARVDISREQS